MATMSSFAVVGTLPSFTLWLLLPILYMAISALIIVAFYGHSFHPLASVPGPFLASFTRAWQTRQYLFGRWHDVALKLHADYGPLVQIAP